MAPSPEPGAAEVHRGWPLAWMLLVAGVSGCAAQQPSPKDHFYRLLPPSEVAAAGNPAMLKGTLLVRRFSADGVLAQRSVVYAESTEPQALYQYNYHFWADPPTRLLQDFTVDYLRRAGLAERVITPEFGASASYVLLGRVRRLEHLRGAVPSVAVALELGVTQMSDGAFLLFETYAATASAAGPSVEDAVAAFNDVVMKLYGQFVADLRDR